MGETVRLPGGITSVDHTFRVPLKWGEGDRGAGAGAGASASAENVEVFARWDGRGVTCLSVVIVVVAGGD